MKFRFVIVFLLLSFIANASEVPEAIPVTEEEKVAVLLRVHVYYELLNGIATGEKAAYNMDMVNRIIMGGNTGCKVFNDFQKDGPEYFENSDRYLMSLKGSNITSNVLSIDCISVNGLTWHKTKMLSWSDNDEPVYRITLQVQRHLTGNGIDKTIMQRVSMRLPDYVITGIYGDVQYQDEAGLDQALYLYYNKQYKEALVSFENCILSTNDILAKYCAAIMYLKKQGCKDMKRSERDERAVRYLKDANNAGITNAGLILNRLGIY